MTVPAHTVSSETTGTDVLLEMLERGLRHLPVLDARRNVIGIVADTDLVAIERRTPFLLRREIREAADRETLASVSRRIGETVIGLHDARVPPAAISRVISAVHDATTRRLLELAEDELGPPPERFTWFALGSFARREAMPSSDSDSALAWAGDDDDPAIKERAAAPRRVGRRGVGHGGHPRLLAGRDCLTPAVRAVGGRLGRGDALVAREPRAGEGADPGLGAGGRPAGVGRGRRGGDAGRRPSERRPGTGR